MGKIHKRVIDSIDNVSVTGIIDSDKKKLNFYKQEITTYEDIKKVNFKKDIYDGAIVSSNTSSHYLIAKTLLENNIPILVEKPITTNQKNFNEIVRKAVKKNLIIRCGFIETYNPIFEYIKSLNLKDIKSIHIFRHSQKIINRDLDNVIFDLVIHDISVLTKLFPNLIIEFVSKNYNSKNNFFDSVDIFLKIKDIPILVSASRESQSKIRRWSIKTENKDYEIDLISKTVNIFEAGIVNFEESQIVSNQVKNTTKSFSNSNESAVIQIKEFIKNLENDEIDMDHLNLINKTHEQIFKINEI